MKHWVRCCTLWLAVVWCGVVWCGVVWCGVVWCGVVWCGVVWCGVVWCGVVWCGVVWCGVVWCGVVWCGVVWCGVLKALLPNGNGQDALHTGNAKREGCVSECALCVVCCAPVAEGCQPLWGWAAAVQGCPRDTLPLCMMVRLKFSLGLGQGCKLTDFVVSSVSSHFARVSVGE